MPSAPYYKHDDPTGSALNNVAAEPAHYDELINKPRVFTYKPNYGASAYGAQQGISHPAPVYYANQPQAQPQPQAPMAYYANQPAIPYATNAHSPGGYYYPSPPPGSAHHPGYPYPYPTAQASAGGGTILPDGTTLFLGKTKEQVMWENQQIAANTGANEPIQMVPYKAAAGQQFWCRELDGSWTLRTVQETMLELQPGYWDKGQSGHAVFIRQKP